MARKWRIAYYSQWIGVIGFLFFFLVPYRRCCLCNVVSPAEKKSPSRAGFYSLLLHYINGVFDAKIHNEVVDVLWWLRLQGMVPGHLFAWISSIIWPVLNSYNDPRVFVKTRMAKFPKSAWLIYKSAPWLLKSAAWNNKLALRVFISLAWVAILDPSSLQLIVLILSRSH